jgi:hypothetical protein
MFMTSTATAIPLLLLGQIEKICIKNKYFTATDGGGGAKQSEVNL